MEPLSFALKSVQTNLKDISLTISNIYKNVPKDHIPNTLREAHNHLNYLQDNINYKRPELPLIYEKHRRSKTTETKIVPFQDPCNVRVSSAAREKFHLQTTMTKFSRLHSNQSYKRPKFARISQARVVPKATRSDPIANPAEILVKDKESGLFNIVNKGLVGKDADLNEFLQFPSLQSKKVPLNTFSSQFQSPVTERKIFTTAVVETKTRKRRISIESPEIVSIRDYDSSNSKKKNKNVKSAVDHYYLIIKRGKIKENSDFLNFKKNYEKK